MDKQLSKMRVEQSFMMWPFRNKVKIIGNSVKTKRKRKRGRSQLNKVKMLDRIKGSLQKSLAAVHQRKHLHKLKVNAPSRSRNLLNSRNSHNLQLCHKFNNQYKHSLRRLNKGELVKVLRKTNRRSLFELSELQLNLFRINE